MIRNIRRRYFEVWGDEQSQNVFLKGFVVVLAALFLIESIALLVLCLRKPELIAVGQSETKVFTVQPPSAELLKEELKRTVKKYLETHYNWEPATVEKAHQVASLYVAEKFVKAFNSANAEQVKIAKDQKISEKVYPGDPIVDDKALTARVSMDRILVINGLRTTSPLTLDVTFEYGPRTASNPEGIYVTGEKVIDPQR